MFGVRFNAVASTEDSEAARATRLFFQNSGLAQIRNPYKMALMIAPALSPLIDYFETRFPTKMDRELSWATRHLSEICNKMYERATSTAAEFPAASNASTDALQFEEGNPNNFIHLLAHAQNRETGAFLTKDEIMGKLTIPSLRSSASALPADSRPLSFTHTCAHAYAGNTFLFILAVGSKQRDPRVLLIYLHTDAR